MTRPLTNILILLGLCIFLSSCETLTVAPSNTYKHDIYYDDSSSYLYGYDSWVVLGELPKTKSDQALEALEVHCNTCARING